jgi:hypothetical protein
VTALADDKLVPLPHALVGDVQSWLQRADLWRLVTRGEELAKQLERRVVESDLIEAWVCGDAKICVSSRLLRAFTPAELQAALAHEIGHLVIARNYEAHPQLWEAQCDLFAAALLRDLAIVKQMLTTLQTACRDCSDAEHPTAAERVGLLEFFAPAALAKVARLDQLRAGSFAIGFQGRPNEELRRLSFAIQSTEIKPERRLNFPIILAGVKPALAATQRQSAVAAPQKK